MKSDVIVIGGGIIGCAVASELAARGVGVSLFERGLLGREASWASAGMLAPQTEAESGGPFFDLCRKSSDLYADFVEDLKDLTGLDPCRRMEGSILAAMNESDAAEMDRAYAWQFEAELPIERLTAEEARKLEPLLAPSITGALFFPFEHQVDNRKLVECVSAAAERRGVKFRLGAQVSEIMIEKGAVCGVVANGERFYSAKVINAAGCWASLLSASQLQLPSLSPVRGQMMSLKLPAGRLDRVIHYRHNYLVPRWDGAVVVGSTTELAGYDKRVTAGGLGMLLHRAQSVVPALKESSFIETWAGLRPAAADELPILGEHPEAAGLVFAAGHYRNGILLTPITAKLIADSIMPGCDVEALAPFSPSRFLAISY